MPKMITISVQYLVILLNCLIKIHVIADSRILHGYRCPIENHPSMVSVRHRATFRQACGGTILSNYWILTAGHCCNGNQYTAVAGLSIIAKNASAENRRLVVNYYKHVNALDNDVCVMKLDKPLTQSKSVQFVKLATTKDVKIEKACKKATAVGWGKQMRPNNAPDDPHLQCVELSIYLDKKECEHFFEHFQQMYLAESIVCFSGKDGKDTCYGDSGGPVFCNGIQYALVSYGIGCGINNTPAAYTRVDIYEDFIRNVILRKITPRDESSQSCKSIYSILILLCLMLVLC